MRVVIVDLRFFACVVFVVVMFTGCDGGSSSPALSFSSFHSRAMPPEGAKIPAPRGATFSTDGRLFVLDDAGRVLVYDSEGKLLKKWFMPAYDVGRPEGIAIFKDGRVAVADTHYHRVVMFDQEGKVLSLHGDHGKGHGDFHFPVAIVQDPDENYYVAEYGGGDRVQKFDVNGKFLTVFGGFGSGDGEFQRPSGIVWHEGHIFVADAINNRVQVFKDSGAFVRIAGAPDALPPLHYPYDLAKGPSGDLYVVEYGGNRLTRIDTQGRVVGTFGSAGTSSDQFSTPWGVAVDSAGTVVVCDTGNRRMVELRE